MRWILCLVTALGLAATAEMSLTVAQLIQFIHSAIELKQPDRQVAEYLKHVRMAEKLDDQTIEDLQGQGAGPKTVAALKELGTPPRTLPQPLLLRRPSQVMYNRRRRTPSSRQDHRRDARICQNYTKNLPNFICVQVTRRDVDPTGTGTAWHHLDTITTKLSYNGGHEDYQIVLVNNAPRYQERPWKNWAAQRPGANSAA